MDRTVLYVSRKGSHRARDFISLLVFYVAFTKKENDMRLASVLIKNLFYFRLAQSASLSYCNCNYAEHWRNWYRPKQQYWQHAHLNEAHIL